MRSHCSRDSMQKQLLIIGRSTCSKRLKEAHAAIPTEFSIGLEDFKTAKKFFNVSLSLYDDIAMIF
jgi:hypothetical protein